MLIRETFATAIEERIEPVVKVADRRSATILQELNNLIITPQWERYFHTILEEYADAFDREDEQSIGIWISGFFGSGKSLLMKLLGVLLEGGELRGSQIHEIFLNRISDSIQRSDLERFLHTCRTRLQTTYIGSNLFTQQSSSDDPLALIAFKMFADQQGYTRNWPFAWAIEYQMDVKDRTQSFREQASAMIGMDWKDIAQDAAFYNEQLYRVAAQVLPEWFSNVESIERAIRMTHENGITSVDLIKRLRDWCERRDVGNLRQKVLLQFDELGQWINSGVSVSDRLMKVQALVEEASMNGSGRIWISVTAHGDVQEYQGSIQQTLYSQINQRFALKCRLSNEDINAVVQARVLRKTQAATSLLSERFQQRRGDIADLMNIQANRKFGPDTTAESVAQFYPYLPWAVAAIPEIVKSIAHAIGRDDALSGSNRTLIGVIQGGILESEGLLDAPIGRILCVADLYPQLESDIPAEMKTDLGQILSSVPHADKGILKIARVLYILDQVEYIDCTVDNINRALANTLDYQLSAERATVGDGLERLVDAGFAKRVGNSYTFLSRQQRSFQDKVHARQDELLQRSYELSQRLKRYDSNDVFRFDRVSLSGVQGSEKVVRLEIDGRFVRNRDEAVTISLFSPLQYIIDSDVRDDAIMQQRSLQQPNTIILRMDNVIALRRELALALATEEVADEVLNAGNGLDRVTERDIARKAKQEVEQYTEKNIRKHLSDALRLGKIFWNGTPYLLMQGENAPKMVQNTLSHLLSNIYARFREVPHRIVNEEVAVKAALTNSTTNADLEALKVYKADGSLNESHSLISSLRGQLMQTENIQGFMSADQLRTHFAQPPYGWDGQCIKVGLALLLRAGGCQLIADGRTITDPIGPDAQRLLTREQSFRTLRVKSVRTDLEPTQLAEIRGYMDTIFGEKPTLVPATLNAKLGEQLTRLHTEAQSIKNWSTLANCPLPTQFEAGNSLVSEMLGNAVQSARLRQFMDVWETLFTYKQLLDGLAHYQQEYGLEYGNVRDFFNLMVNAQIQEKAQEVKHFIEDWRTVTQVERNVTDSTLWKQIVASYHHAQQAVTDYIVTTRQSIEKELARLEERLPTEVQNAGVPAEQIEQEVQKLMEELQNVHKMLDDSVMTLGNIHTLETQLLSARVSIQSSLQLLRGGHQLRQRSPTSVQFMPPEQPSQLQVRETASIVMQPPTATQNTEITLTWQQVLGRIELTSSEDIEQLVSRLRQNLTEQLAQGQQVIIE